MCTPSLAVVCSWMVALGGFGRSAGICEGHLVALGCAGVAHGAGVVGDGAGASDEAEPASGEPPEPPQAVSTAARAASAIHDAPRVRSMRGHPLLGSGWVRRRGSSFDCATSDPG